MGLGQTVAMLPIRIFVFIFVLHGMRICATLGQTQFKLISDGGEQCRLTPACLVQHPL